jgi:hypothetical protein
MNLNLHRNARTTPAIRQELRASTKSERELAREYNLNRATVRKWRRRDSAQDAVIPVLRASDKALILALSLWFKAAGARHRG